MEKNVVSLKDGHTFGCLFYLKVLSNFSSFARIIILQRTPASHPSPGSSVHIDSVCTSVSSTSSSECLLPFMFYISAYRCKPSGELIYTI